MLELGWAPMGYKAVLRRYFEQQYSADAKPMNLPVKKVRARARVREIRAIAEHAKRKRLADAAFVNSDAFLESYAWRRVRMEALKKHGSRCQCCGASPADGLRMHVDHIKPRRKYPDLALDVNNLQVLCEVCNHGKGNWDETDWRPDESEHSEDTIGKTLRIIRGGKE
ncbi:MAG: HNH endonuclease [Alphaproteobacteria bacterium]|nr:HNH endonuclease [Alphaproteobacteria bacterium]